MSSDHVASPTGDTPPPCPHISDAIFRLIVEYARDAIIHATIDGERTYVSPSVFDVVGYLPSELLGGGVYELVHPDDRPQMLVARANLTDDNPSVDLTFRARHKDGHYVWIAGRYRMLPERQGIVAMLSDITAQKTAELALAESNAQLEAANRNLLNLVHQDGLTGIANRRRFDEVLDAEFRRARREQSPLGLVLFDVDHFKKFNDRYGHTAGDECLRRVAKAAQQALRRPCDLIARYGGEELVAVLPATCVEGSINIGERVRQAVAALKITHEVSSYGFATISAGASAIIPTDTGETPLGLINAADAALYQAKLEGRNRVLGRMADWQERQDAEPLRLGE